MEYICNYCNKNFGNHQTEYRKHRKVCDCKPEFFECKFCHRKFSRAGACASHEKHDCALNPDREKFERYSIFKDPNFDSASINHPKEDGWTCRCGKNFRVRQELQDHRKVCDACKNKDGETIAKKTYINFKCEFCGFEKETTREAATVHIKFCKENPNHLIKKSHTLSEESKKKISEARKKYLNEHPDEIPFKLNHSSKESYPEKYFREWLQKENIFSERELQVSLYTLDFAWPEKKIYLEIDGSQHHLDWMVKHDEERTKKLSELGWNCIQRIYWPDYQKLSKNEKEKYLASLKEEILKII